jgi:5-formyltetrahydrofolate cyclo-ligase
MTAQAGDTTSLASRKAKLRKELRQRRRALPLAQRRQAARRAALHLAHACRRWQVRAVALYLGVAEELDTRPLIEALRGLRPGMRLYAPRVGRDHALHFTRLGPPLVRNRYGIREPAVLRRPPRLDLIVLPVVGFDEAGRRLGMGGGYYDRLLARSRATRRPLRVGYAFASQEVRAVPAAAHDVRLDAIVTERGFRRFR